MGDRLLPIRQRIHCAARLSVFPSAVVSSALIGLGGVAGVAVPSAAHAQDAAPAPAPERESRGSIIIEVLDAVTGEPVPNVVVRFSSETERPRSFVTGPDGRARLRLAASTYEITLNGAVAGYETRQERTRRSQVTGYVLRPVDAGNPQILTFTLQRRIDEDRIRRQRELVRREEVSDVTNRDREFFRAFPFGVGNQQSLSKELRSIPGFVPDSINQVHVRGENSVNKATYLDGVLLPASLAGSGGQPFSPTIVDNIAARVGGIQPRFGGGSNILDLTLRPSTNYPALEYNASGGEYNTGQIGASFSNSLFRPTATNPSGARGRLRNLRYFVDYSLRNTDESLEPPQDSMDNYKNYGLSQTIFAKLDLDLGPQRGISLILNTSQAKNGVAARNGFGPSLAPFGGGFGFLGESSVFTATSPLPSQTDLFQHQRQSDDNYLAMLKFNNRFNNGSALALAIGVAQTQQQISNRDETIQVGQNNLPTDNSVEFLPFGASDYTSVFVQGDYDLGQRGNHRVRAGALVHNFTGDDSYRFFPQSIYARNALAALDPRLVALGGTAPGSDARGNPNYVVNDSSAAAVPLFQSSKDGTYTAAYVEDNFRIRPWLRVNYGFRFDSYKQNLAFRSDTPITSPIQNRGADTVGDTSTISPRINYAIVLPRKLPFGIPLGFLTNQTTVLRISYNRLFTPPYLTQGNFLSRLQAVNTNANTEAAGPQITDSYDLSVERQVGPVGIFKAAVFSKRFDNALSVRQIFPGLQAGLTSLTSLGDGSANGYELHYESLPYQFEERGIYYYIGYNNTRTGPRNGTQQTNLGELVTQNRYDFDQTETLSAGFALNLRGATIGLSAIAGSGLYNSSFEARDTTNAVPLFTTGRHVGSRSDYNEVNFSFATGPRFLNGRASLQLMVENLLDSQERLNWRTGIGGTRYQQGRRLLIGVTGRL